MRATLHALTSAALLLQAVAAAGCGSDGEEPHGPPAATAPPATAATQTAVAPRARPAAQIPRGVGLASIGSFDAPLYVTAPPGDRRRLFVVEQAGRIVVVRGGRRLADPFLDIRNEVTSGGEQGLLSLAFAPDYATSGRFYVYFTDSAGDQRIVEYRRATADRADRSSARLVLQMDDEEGNHNGGLLLFGPDRLMYVGTGDGGGANDQHGTRGNGQDLGSLLGKILRIDPRPDGDRPYRVPSSNPFAGRAGARGEIWSYGLRNPWRFSFDARTGDLVVADVGQNAIEEVSFVSAANGRGRGVNFGWRPFEGRRRNFEEPAPAALAPVITHSHATGFCSITGGYVVRDPRLPGLAGRYVYGDYCEGRIRSARLRTGRATAQRRVGVPRVASLSSFGEDAARRVYVTSLDGPVYRLVAR